MRYAHAGNIQVVQRKGCRRRRKDLSIDEFIVLILGSNALSSGLGTRRHDVVVQTEHLVLLLDQLIRLANLVALDGLRQGEPQNLAAVAGSTLGVERVGDSGIWDGGNRGVVDLFVGRRIATGVRDVVLDGRTMLVDTDGALQGPASVRLQSSSNGGSKHSLWHSSDPGGSRTVLLSPTARSIGGAMGPLHARGLVAVGLLGLAAQVAVEDLTRCHGGAVESLLAG